MAMAIGGAGDVDDLGRGGGVVGEGDGFGEGAGSGAGSEGDGDGAGDVGGERGAGAGVGVGEIGGIAPATVTEEMVSVPVPELVTVTRVGPLVAPWEMAGKLRGLGAIMTAGTAGAE